MGIQEQRKGSQNKEIKTKEEKSMEIKGKAKGFNGVGVLMVGFNVCLLMLF